MEGTLVKVDGHNMNIYQEGSGAHTIVFLAGSGIPSPVFEYRTLYRCLARYCKVVVIEKFGYGYSDVVDTERSFETMLRQDREALSALGINGPLILCPHSMSGVEALKWAQEHPQEVEAVVGLDMAVPEAYDTIEERIKKAESSWKLFAFLKKTGLLSLLYKPAKTLSQEDQGECRKIACDKIGNITTKKEAEGIAAVRDEIRSRPKPDVPFLFFVSNGKGTGDKEEIWRGFTATYSKDLRNAKTINVSCGHNLHNVEYELIAKEMRTFIDEL